jgi:hypothetical protein
MSVQHVQGSALPGLTATELRERIIDANAWLETNEPDSVSIPDDGKGYIGYKIDWVVEAANTFIGEANWRYELVSMDTLDEMGKVAEAALCVFVRVNGEWVSKGDTFGGGAGHRDKTDGKKAAISDAVKKGLALWGLGDAAYQGELAEEYGERQRGKKKTSTPRRERAEASEPKPEPKTEPKPEPKPVSDGQRPAPAAHQYSDEPVTDKEYDAIIAYMQSVVDPATDSPYFTSRSLIEEFVVALGFPAGLRLRDLPRMIDGKKTADLFDKETVAFQKRLRAQQSPTSTDGSPLAADDSQPWRT